MNQYFFLWCFKWRLPPFLLLMFLLWLSSLLIYLVILLWKLLLATAFLPVMRGDRLVGRRIRSHHGTWVVVLLIVVRGYWTRELGSMGIIRMVILLQKLQKHFILFLLNVLHLSNLQSDIAWGFGFDIVEIAAILRDLSSCWLMFLLEIYQWRWFVLLRQKKHLSSQCFSKFLRLCAICFFDLFRWQKESRTLLHAFFRRIYPGFMASLPSGLIVILKSIEVVGSSSDVVGLPVGRKNFNWLPSCDSLLI